MKIKSCSWASLVFLFIFWSWQQALKAEDADKAKWTPTGSLLTARVSHTATLLPDGQVLIVGGYGVSGELASAELYRPRKGTFVPTGNLGSSRMNHTATLLSNGKVLVVGGQSGGNTLNSVELYDPGTGLWTPASNLHVARSFHSATLLPDGQVLVAGGTRQATPPVYCLGVPPGSALDIAELYNPRSGKWTVVDNLHSARFVHTATLLDNGKVLVAGGIGAKGASDILDSAELYDPKTKTWTVTGSLLKPRINHSSTLLPNGQVLVLGGQCHAIILASGESYDPSKRTWTVLENFHTQFNGQTTTLLPDHRVLVAGGANDPNVLASSELSSPSLETWKAISNMNTGHCGHTATLLSNGQVLVAGGLDALGSPTNVQANAELYAPGTKPKPKGETKPVQENTPQPYFD